MVHIHFPRRGGLGVSVYEALSLMIAFAMLVLALERTKRKNSHGLSPWS